MCDYGQVLGADLPLATEVLSGAVTDSLIESCDAGGECNAVLEETAMNGDNLSGAACWAGP